MNLVGQNRRNRLQHYIVSPYPTLPIDGYFSSLVHGDTVVHTLDVRLLNRVAGRKANYVDLRLGSGFHVLPCHLAQGFGMDYGHRKLAILSVHQGGELFLLQHVRLDVSVLTELLERFEKHVILLQFFQGTHLPFPFEDIGAVLYNPKRVLQ